MYTVYGTKNSRALRVLWLLEELGAAYHHIPAQPRSDEVRALSPSGKIPVLTVEGRVLTDSVAIMTYLADAYGAFTHPAGTVERAAQDAQTQMICDEIDAVLWTAAKHSFVLPEDLRHPAVKDSLRWELARSFDRIAEGLADQDYLLGDGPLIPDFLLTHCLGWAVSARFRVEPTALRAFADRMRDRPAYQRALALN